jgi:hypothetical protein
MSYLRNPTSPCAFNTCYFHRSIHVYYTSCRNTLVPILPGGRPRKAVIAATVQWQGGHFPGNRVSTHFCGDDGSCAWCTRYQCLAAGSERSSQPGVFSRFHAHLGKEMHHPEHLCAPICDMWAKSSGATSHWIGVCLGSMFWDDDPIDRDQSFPLPFACIQYHGHLSESGHPYRLRFPLVHFLKQFFLVLCPCCAGGTKATASLRSAVLNLENSKHSKVRRSNSMIPSESRRANLLPIYLMVWNFVS